MLKGTRWLPLLLVFAVSPLFGAEGDNKGGAKKEEKQKWKVHVLTPTVVERPRIGWVLVEAEQTRTVCKECLVCITHQVASGRKCCIYCRKEWHEHEQVFRVPGLILQDLPTPLAIESTKVEKLDFPKPAPPGKRGAPKDEARAGGKKPAQTEKPVLPKP